MVLTFDFEVMYLRQEGFSYLRGCAGEINQHPAGIDHVHLKSVRFEPADDNIEVGLCQPETFAEFLRAQPVMEVWRTFALQFVEKLLKRQFLLGGAFQLEQHVVHGETVRHAAAVVRWPRFGMRIARKRDAIHFIDSLRDSRASTET